MLQHLQDFVAYKTIDSTLSNCEIGECVEQDRGVNPIFHIGVTFLGLDPREHLVGNGTIEQRFARGIQAFCAKCEKSRLHNNYVAVNKGKVCHDYNNPWHTLGHPFEINRVRTAKVNMAALLRAQAFAAKNGGRS